MNIFQWLFFVPKIIASILMYLITEFKNDGLELPFPCWFPFNWKNPFGYLVACALQYILIRYLFIFVVFCVYFEIGFYFLLVSIADDIKRCIKSLNQNAKSKRKRLKLSKEFGDFIQFHSHTKQLSKIWSKLVILKQKSTETDMLP